MDTTVIQTVIKDYYKQEYANKMANLEEINIFLQGTTYQTEPRRNTKYE